MNGTASDTFDPSGTMTRGMIVTVPYWFSEDSYDNGFTDVASGAWYEDAVAWAYANGIVSGVGGKSVRAGRRGQP
ncbi:MAG: S-layer homology domain-containing protein [Bacillota bacterium]